MRVNRPDIDDSRAGTGGADGGRLVAHKVHAPALVRALGLTGVLFTTNSMGSFGRTLIAVALGWALWCGKFRCA